VALRAVAAVAGRVAVVRHRKACLLQGCGPDVRVLKSPALLGAGFAIVLSRGLHLFTNMFPARRRLRLQRSFLLMVETHAADKLEGRMRKSRLYVLVTLLCIVLF